MKFIADVMLGRLAKRMRLLGLDVLYDRTLDDNEIIRRALEQNRVILTRDTALAKRPLAMNHVFINGNSVQEQLHQLLEFLPLEQSLLPLTRCSLCNEPLEEISRNEARDLVPAHVYETCASFLRCAKCGRIYWTGTHVRRMGISEARKTKKPGSSSGTGPAQQSRR